MRRKKSIKSTIRTFIQTHFSQFLLSILRNIVQILNYASINIKRVIKLRYLRLHMDTINTCNHRCKYCYTLGQENPHLKKMTIEEFKKIADELFPLSKYVALSCQTEPTTNKQFAEYIDIASKYNVPELFFVTNAELLTDEVIISSINAPVHEIAISIDAANDEMYKEIRGASVSFEKTINCLKRIHELKKEYNSSFPKVRINFTLFNENAVQMPELVEQYKEYFDVFMVNHLRLRLRNDTNPYSRMNEKDFADIVKKTIQKAGECPLDFDISFGPIMKRYGLCSTSVEYLYIGSDGDVSFCNEEIVGNINEKSYNEILKNNANLFKQLQFARHERCQDCGE